MDKAIGLLRGFRFAFRGLFHAIRTQRNMRIHLNAVAFVILAGMLARFPGWKWAAVLICCGLVLALETMNTAIETLCDRISPEKDPLIAAVKDCAAGAVLAAAIVSAAVAVILLCSGDTLQNLLDTVKTSPWTGIVLAAAIILSILNVLVFSAWGTEKKQNGG